MELDEDKTRIVLAALRLIANGKPRGNAPLNRTLTREIAREALIQIGDDWTERGLQQIGA